MSENNKPKHGNSALQKIRDNTIAEIAATTAEMTNTQKFGYLYKRVKLLENQIIALQVELDETCKAFTSVSLNSNTST